MVGTELFRQVVAKNCTISRGKQIELDCIAEATDEVEYWEIVVATRMVNRCGWMNTSCGVDRFRQLEPEASNGYD